MAVGAAATLDLRAGQLAAIVEAQFRSQIHFYGRGSRIAGLFAAVMSLIWYGLIAVGAWAASIFCAQAGPDVLRNALSAGALFTLIYWQFIPLMLVSAGAGLDLKRLVVYPLSARQLFVLDVVLRFTTGLEVLLLIGGATAGLLRNPAVAWWGPFAFVPFVAMNLGLASGLRALVGRWMTSRRTREITMLALVLTATLPQLFLTTSLARRMGIGEDWAALGWLPWTLVGHAAAGQGSVAGTAGMIVWVAAAWAFGWWQFRRTLRWDDTAARARKAGVETAAWREWVFTWPAAVFRDPMAALVEKELRSLARAPRFRVVFIMGFSFSLLIWLPMMARSASGQPPSFFLALMFGYALLLLGESCFWNVLGFDRGAAQFYFLAPQPVRAVLRAKNVAAAVVVAMEFVCISAVALALRLPVTGAMWMQAMGAGAVVTLLMLAAGNLGSVYAPRPSDPSDVWRKGAAAKTQALGVLMSPVLAAPVLLAWLAQYAFDSAWAFWAVLVLVAMMAAVVYSVALDSATEAATRRREQITAVLSRGAGPVQG